MSIHIRIEPSKDTLSFYQRHPIVVKWRELNKNSFMPVTIIMAREWNKDKMEMLLLVKHIIENYLIKLTTHIKNKIKKMKSNPSAKFLQNRFNLNKVESKIIYYNITGE